MKAEIKYLKYEDEISPLAQKIFGDISKEIYRNLDDNEKEKFLRIVFFYYHRYFKIRKENNYNFDEGLILVVITSAIEALISEMKFKDFITWYKSECINRSLSVEELWKDYILKYGAAKKFIYFWEKFVDEKDKKRFKDSSWSLSLQEDNTKGKEEITIKEMAKILYRFRSEFVHRADYVPVVNPSSTNPNEIFLGSGFSLDNKAYNFGVTMDELASMFERGFVNYFKKVEELIEE